MFLDRCLTATGLVEQQRTRWQDSLSEALKLFLSLDEPLVRPRLQYDEELRQEGL